MTNKADLETLLAKVEAGDVPPEKYMGPFEHCFDHNQRDWAWRAYNGSLDAAHSLHKAVLGDRFKCKLHVATCTVLMYADGYAVVNGYATRSKADNPARAWLIAIIKALIAEAGE